LRHTPPTPIFDLNGRIGQHAVALQNFDSCGNTF
jgi:hypothetical protein